MTKRVLIADDHGVLRGGLRALLNGEPDFEVVTEASDGDSAITLAERFRPDIVLLDMSMPGPGGVEVTRRLKERLPSVRVLILTVHEDPGLLRETLRAEASGFVVKRAAESELISALRAVSRGDMYIHPAMTRTLAAQSGETVRVGGSKIGTLTPRELEVLRLVAAGHTNKQVAGKLGIGVRTVETHRANLMDKLGVGSRVELVRFAIEHKLVD
ncbi:MAG: response regulator [Acidobacteriota bacterium]